MTYKHPNKDPNLNNLHHAMEYRDTTITGQSNNQFGQTSIDYTPAFVYAPGTLYFPSGTTFTFTWTA